MTAITREERLKWVGASEVAALLGVSPYTTKFEIWHAKKGNIPAANLDGSERVEAGRFLEPAIAAWANHKWNWDVRNVPDYRPHGTVAGMGASLDFETGDGEPVEVKNVDYLVFRDKWEHEGEALISAPDHILVQVQAQMACTPGAERAWIIVCVGGNTIYRMPVDRHLGLIAKIEREVAAFWQSIRDNVEPKPDFSADLDTIGMLYSKGDGGVVDLTGSNRIPELCATYLHAKADEKSAKARADAALAEIKEAVGTASRAMVVGFKITVSDIAETVTAPSVRKGYRKFTIKEAA